MYRVIANYDDKSLCYKRLTEDCVEFLSDTAPRAEYVLGPADEVKPGSKKEYEVNGRKVLVVNDVGEWMAVSGVCTHYGAPLVWGTYHNGKVRCPYHGACFSTTTGDIEDYPSFDALQVYQIFIRDGSLILKANEKQLSSDRREKAYPRIEIKKEEKPVVVVGGGAAAQIFLEHYRLAEGSAPLTLVSEEKHLPYDRVLLSKYLSLTDAPLYRLATWFEDRKITTRLGARVTDVCPDEHKIRLSDGGEIEYSKLVIATGGNVRKLTVPGGDLKNVLYVRRLEHTAEIHANMNKDANVVCIGGSFIGMEVAANVYKHVQSVTVVVTGREPLAALGDDVGAAYRKKFESEGIKFKLSSRVQSLTGDGGKVNAVLLEGGERLPADMVVAGIGTTPSTLFLNNSGIELDKAGFILVDKDFKTNMKDVFAIGDVVSAPLPLWNIPTINIQHFKVAQTHGELCAYSVLGKKQPGHLIPFFWTHTDMAAVRFAGSAYKSDSFIMTGDVDNFDFVKYMFRDDIVVAVVSSGMNMASIEFLGIWEKGKKITRKQVEENLANHPPQGYFQDYM